MTAANGKPPGHTDRVRQLAAELDGQDDEITETQIIVQPGAIVNVDQTGRHRAMSDEITKTDHGSPPKRSGWPERVSGALQPLLGGLTPWGKALVLLALIGVLALAVWRGAVGAGLLP